MEQDHRERDRELEAAEALALPVQGRLPGQLIYAVPVGATRPAGEEGAGLLAEAAGRDSAIKRRQRIARRP
jgi:hypothetical protein